MQHPFPGPVVVVVPHEGVESALRFAAREAVLSGAAVRLVGPTGVIERAARVTEVLAGPGVPVDLRARADLDLERVLGDNPDASLLVVHRSSALHLIDALSNGFIGRRALVEVACVPPGWAPRPDDDRPIVVAVDDAFHAGDLIAAGARHAARRGCVLLVVHAWDLVSNLESEEDKVLESMWAEELARRLALQLAGLADPVCTDVRVRRGAAADVVTEAAQQARMVVLGRSLDLDEQLCHLGRTSRTLLRECPVPVLLLQRRGADRDGPAAREQERSAGSPSRQRPR